VTTPAKAAAVMFENRIRASANESGAFFDKHGVLVLERTGDPGKVGFTTRELWGMFEKTFTHNHPAGYTFTYDRLVNGDSDIHMAAVWGLAEIRVVTRDLRFMLAPGTAGWPSPPLLDAAIVEARNTADRVVADLVKTDKLNVRFAEFEYEHQVVVQIANEFGLLYRREKS